MSNEIESTERVTDTWNDIDRAFDAMARHFAESFGVAPFGPTAAELGVGVPPTDITDTGRSYRVVAEVPGIPKEKLDIRIRGAAVEIRGENGTESEQKEANYLRRERAYSSYFRAFELPEPVVAAEAKATVTNGVLTLELPKQTPTPSEPEVKVSVA